MPLGKTLRDFILSIKSNRSKSLCRNRSAISESRSSSISGGSRFAKAAGGLFTDVFRPGEYSAAGKIAAAERFLGGGTDFKNPMRKAVELMETGDFEQAYIVFITDGDCDLPPAFIEQLREKQGSLGFTVTGILLDAGASMEFSLKTFCEKIYRTSELMGEEIIRDIVAKRT